jgi:chromosome segregation ATPase
MKRMVLTLCALMVVGWSASAVAETPVQVCDSKKAVVVDLEKTKTGIEAEIITIGDELKALEVKKKELNGQRAEKYKAKAKTTQAIKLAKVNQKAACIKVMRCKKAKDKVAKLREKRAPLREKLKAIRGENKERNKNASAIKAKIEALEKQYTELNCRNLVAGKTAQKTIDKCNGIFSAWNALQKELNGMLASTGKIKGRHGKVRGQMKGLRKQLKGFKRQIKINCLGGPEMKEVEAVEAEQKDEDAIVGEIKETQTKCRKMKKRKVVIVKPRVKPAKKGKGKFKVSLKAKGSVKAKGSAKAKGGKKVEAKGSAKAKGSVKVQTK